MSYTYLLFGVLFFLAVKLNSAKAKDDFTWKYFFSKNWVNALMNLIAGIIIIQSGYFIDKIKDVPTLNLFYAFLGSGGALALQALFDVFDKDKKTAIGVKDKEQ